jgi:outer membrane receptor protein involved in Fe transport
MQLKMNPVAFVAAAVAAAAFAPDKFAQASEKVTVTGSRIVRTELLAPSPTVTVSSEQIQANQDITLDTFLNTLPQVNPAGTTTSNNPGNNGQSNIDLRGLGASRTLVLIDGRRPMVSSAGQSVDLNTIPLALIEGIDVVTGGASAVYGTDALGGAVNIKLKRNFNGLDIRTGLSNHISQRDAQDVNFSLVTGGNFADSRGNAVFAFDYAKRQGMIKAQRGFSATATSTTSFFPEGLYTPSSTNAPSQAAVDAIYGQSSYGSILAGRIPAASNQSFNTDGTLFYPGVFNNKTLDVVNFRYPIDSGVNTNFYPDFYSYNFDAVNILTLPLERRSAMGRFELQVTKSVQVFSQFSYTNYTSASALAPSPVPTVVVRNPGAANLLPSQATSSLVEVASTGLSGLPVPVTNPFIPADLKRLLDSRTGNDLALVGSGATEPFLIRWRTVAGGLRQQNLDNTVTQALGGFRGDIGSTGWTWEAYLSEGRTKILNTQTGNIDTNRLVAALGAADGGKSLCAGGVNPFGRQELSAACVTYLTVANQTTTDLQQRIGQVFVAGDVGRINNAPISIVAGAEKRAFQYKFDPGSASGPISGFNTATPAGGKNEFTDIFGEFQLPVARKLPFAQAIDLGLALRSSQSQFDDSVKKLTSSSKRSNAFALTGAWQPNDETRVRGAFQRAVRAPNFGELFSGGGNAPQIYDPCNADSAARTGAAGAQVTALCQATGVAASVLPTFVASPGAQVTTSFKGNTDLNPEKGSSLTLGAIWAPSAKSGLKGFSFAADYYRIKVSGAISGADTNELIADCYNFYGRNPSYSKDYVNCQALIRSGGNLALTRNPLAADGQFTGANGGSLITSGIDLQGRWTGLVGPGRMDVSANVNR